MVNENLIILFLSGWIGAVYGQCEIYYIIFSGCLALDCWLLKKFSYSLSVGKSIVTDHLSGISVSRYIFVGQKNRQSVYLCQSAKVIPTPLTATDRCCRHTSIPTDGLSVQRLLPTDPQSVYRGCGIVS